MIIQITKGLRLELGVTDVAISLNLFEQTSMMIDMS
jgi:hypothetical protein